MTLFSKKELVPEIYWSWNITKYVTVPSVLIPLGGIFLENLIVPLNANHGVYDYFFSIFYLYYLVLFSIAFTAIFLFWGLVDTFFKKNISKKENFVAIVMLLVINVPAFYIAALFLFGFSGGWN